MSHRFHTSLSQWIALTLAIVLSSTLVACSQPTGSSVDKDSVTSQGNPPLESVQRIVALTSLSADITQQLDSTKLVGIPGSPLLDNDPRFAELTKVSQGQTPPSLEKIIALEPDLVIGATGFHDRIAARLAELEIDTYLTTLDSWQSLEELTKAIASAINVDPEPLLSQYEQFIQSPAQSDSSLLILASTQPILSPNKNSWSGDLLTRLNIENVVADLQGNAPISGYITLSPEKLIQIDPDRLIVIQFGGQSPLPELQENGFWSELKAVKNEDVHVFDYYGLINPGSIAAIAKASAQLQELRAIEN
ncbi:ABC transporter substrate-binding protein [Roseofilum casamattae]|uniref:ABC transporter substrate-binding protein n=1 Tax=Roseofilum casamattae BLCC-M143 TaxID=3022442 RepID=A0ABT7C1P5_9CYAN|nr:ABC transporter substrate-binding protein [Roseofilum casamattae]MDJ1184448.1 ABC transporter substrate-binding protein [Roseofilum casamattae BLCC-M143]